MIVTDTRGAIFAVILLIFMGHAIAEPEVDAELEAELQRIHELGNRIFRHYHAAIVVTDAMFAEVPDFTEKRELDGWITKETDDGILVIFGRVPENGPALAYYQVLTDDEGEVSGGVETFGPPREMDEALSASFRARQLASHSDFQACSEYYNTVVLPKSSGNGGWLVYLLPGATDEPAVPAGGNFRLEISEDGNEIISQRAFTKSCMSILMRDDVMAIALTHLLDPIPTEIHVFLMRLAHKPVYLLTTSNEKIWAVEGPGIRLVSDETGD